jgi:glycosyltransferase involved in cell wall biosynthesis
VSGKVVVLDSHQFDDNRISKHISSVSGKYPVFRLNFNFYADRPIPVSTEGAKIINFTPTKNPYLNGALLSLKTMIGMGIAPLESSLRKDLVKDGDQLIIHVHDPYLLGLAAKLSRRFPDSRIVYDRHEYYETWKNHFGFSAPGWFEGRYGGRVSEVVFVIRDYHNFPRSLQGKKVTVVPNYPLSQYFDLDKVMKKIEAMEDGEICAAYFGVLNSNFDRDIELMFQVMRSVMERNEHVRFCVAGRVYDKSISSMMDDMKAVFGERMSYLGEIPYREVVERTQKAHLGFFLLRPESPMWSEERPVSPNKVYEYLLSGTVPIIRATLDDRKTIDKCSLTFGKDSSLEDIRDGLLKLIDDRERLKRMMLECYEIGLEFSWEKVAGRYVECYERLFGSMRKEK